MKNQAADFGAVARRLEDIERGMRRGAEVGRKRATEALAAKVRELAPVDTGHLRSTVTATDDGVIVSAMYAAWVEFGTVRIVARPFVRPAVAMVAPGIPGIVAESVAAGVVVAARRHGGR